MYIHVLFSNIQENDCRALELKYREAVQEKKEAEIDITKMVRLKLCSTVVCSKLVI